MSEKNVQKGAELWHRVNTSPSCPGPHTIPLQNRKRKVQPVQKSKKGETFCI